MADSNLTPGFLVAMPQLLDPNFERTVVLLIHHDDEGTFGVVLNRSTELNASSLCASLEIDWRGHPDESIDWGGPVQPQTGWMLFGEDSRFAGTDDVKPVAEGVRFAGSLDVLRQIAKEPAQDVRLLLGYAGWGPGQLEVELTEGAWLTAPVTRNVVFDVEQQQMWDHVVRSLGVDPSTLVSTRGVH
ncbi:MAG: YqgE/AlgH family protein [Myxococcales bacterium]|nr:YqgE/AlgH family protein [Myxococcales bacterium]